MLVANMIIDEVASYDYFVNEISKAAIGIAQRQPPTSGL